MPREALEDMTVIMILGCITELTRDYQVRKPVSLPLQGQSENRSSN